MSLLPSDAVGILAQLREHGWRVAAHNDYSIDGKWFTFWLFTHPDGRYVKGEDTTDLGALLDCRRLARGGHKWTAI